MSELKPFARQIALPEVGDTGQARLSQAHVLVVGAGGLGCPVLSYLGRAGVGRITVMDPDVVSLSNLHRQPLFTRTDIGRRKVDVVAEHLAAACPDLKLTPRAEALGASTIKAALDGVDLVLDAADSYAVSYILSDACLARGVALISASALGLSGYVGGFCGAAPSLRAVFPDLPTRTATCASAGVLGPLVGMIGAAQAQMALQYLLDLQPSVLGQMLRFDMGLLSLGSFRFDGAPEPEIAYPFVALDGVEGALRLDLRGTEEAPEVAAGARRVLTTQITTAELPKERPILLICASGLRAWQAAEVLRAKGHSDLALHAVTAP